MTEISLSIPSAIYIWDGSGLVVIRTQLLPGGGGEMLVIRLVSANPPSAPAQNRKYWGAHAEGGDCATWGFDGLGEAFGLAWNLQTPKAGPKVPMQ